MRKIINTKIFSASIQEMALAGIFIALWTVSAAFIRIDFGPMRAGVYLAFAILTGLIFKPFIGVVIALVADNLQLLLNGATWSWLFALLPIITIFSTYFIKQILLIKNEKIWKFMILIFMLIVLASLMIILILNKQFSHSDQGKILNLSALSTQILVWVSFTIFTIIFLALYLSYCFFLKNTLLRKKLKKMINISIIVTFVYIVASWIVGPLATIIWLNQIGGVKQNHDAWTSYYWKMYSPYTIIRIIKTPISLPIHIFIVYSIYSIFQVINQKNVSNWK